KHLLKGKFLSAARRRTRPRGFVSKVFVHLFQKAGGPGPAATRARWAGPCGGAPARGASPKQSFRPPFPKGGRIPKGGALWPLAAASGTPLYFRRIWGFGGLYKRKAPKAPPN